MQTLLTLLAIGLVAWFVLYQWRSSRRPAMPALESFPAPPSELTGEAGAALLPSIEGVYLGTSMAGDWRDRVTVGDIGQRSTATLHLSGAGLLIDRVSASPLWIPATAVRGAKTGRVLVGRPIGNADLLVTWQLGGRLLDCVFRANDDAMYPDWIATLRTMARRRGSNNGAAA
jgi:hypothetical protein